jgi:hypothetical protein
MSKVAKWIFPAAGGKDGIIGTAKAVVGIMTGNWGMIASGVAQVAGLGKKSQGQARQASVLQLTLGETPREAVLGLTCTGGSLVDVFNFGGQYGTDTVTRCVALADHLIDGIVGFYVDDKYYPWVGDGLQAAFSNKLGFHFRNASSVGHEPPLHVRQNGGWVATDRMVGIPHIWIDWYVDEKVWPQGHPTFRFVLRGLRAYDPRFDPQLGYSGPSPQTWDNPASHKFTRNAKVLRYAYTRGIYAEGHHGDPNYLLIGRGLTAEEAPPEAVIADANLCDEIVDGVARYTVGGVISASQPFIDVDGMFAAAMAGVIVQREGSVDVEAGQAKAVVATITDDDLVVGEPVSFSRFLPDNDGGRVNTVMGRYVEPSLGYKDHSAPVRRSLTDIQADGGPREQTISLPLVDQVKQVDRITEIQRLLGRLERRASIVLPPKFAGLEEGDWIAWQSARRHGGATVRYRIETYRQPETWRMYLTLREIASSVFGVPDPIEDHVTPPPAPTPLDALSLSGVTVEAITLPGTTSTVPALRFRWTTPVDLAVQAIRAEVRRSGTTEAAPTRTEEVQAGELVTTNGVGPAQALQCRLVPIGDPFRPVLPSPWVTVSTSTIVAGDVAANAPTIVGLNADLAALEALQASETVIREEQINRLSTSTAAIMDGQGGVRLDPTFNLWPAGNARPDNVAAATGLTISRQTTGVIYGDKAMRLVDPGTGNASFPIVAAGFAPASDALHWVVEYQVTVNSGDLKRFGVQFRANRTTGYYGSTVDLAINHPTTTPGVTYRGSKMFTVAPLGGAAGTPTTCQGYFYTNLASFSGGAFSAKDLTLHRLQFRPATPEEIAAGSIPALEASVTQNSLAIVDLETGAALAKFELVAAASGGKPARFKLVSSSLGSAIALDAPWIYFGENTVLDTVTATEQTTVGSKIRVVAKGTPFGAASNLLEWWGPTGIALSAMTTGNGYNGRMTDAPYVFDNVSGAQFRVTCSHRAVAASRVGAGTVTTPLVTFQVSGATGPVTFDVYFVNGDGTITATNSSSSDSTSPFQHQSAFTTSVALGQVKGGQFACAVRDANGNTGSAFVNVGLSEST